MSLLFEAVIYNCEDTVTERGGERGGEETEKISVQVERASE